MLTPYGDQIRGWIKEDPSLSAVAAIGAAHHARAGTCSAPSTCGRFSELSRLSVWCFARRLISEGVSSLLVTPPALTLAGIVMPTGDMETLGNIPP